VRAGAGSPDPRRDKAVDNGGLRYSAMGARFARRYPPPLDPPFTTRPSSSPLAGPKLNPLDRTAASKHHRLDPRTHALGGRLQIGTPAGFRSEKVAGFILECMAGFVGIPEGSNRSRDAKGCRVVACGTYLKPD